MRIKIRLLPVKVAEVKSIKYRLIRVKPVKVKRVKKVKVYRLIEL